MTTNKKEYMRDYMRAYSKNPKFKESQKKSKQKRDAQIKEDLALLKRLKEMLNIQTVAGGVPPAQPPVVAGTVNA